MSGELERAPRARLRAADAARTAFGAVRSQRLRAALSALGIAIGVGAIVTVIGLSSTSRAAVDAEFDRLGSNLLTVTPGAGLDGPRPLPASSGQAVAALDGVAQVAVRRRVTGLTVRRTPFIPLADTSGITVTAADTGLVAALGLELGAGRYFDRATTATPVVVLGAVSARRLGAAVGDQVYLGEEAFTVVGVLRPTVLAEDLDTAAIMGDAYARRKLAGRTSIGALHVRVARDRVDAVRPLLGPTADPASPATATVTRPTDALRARAITDSALDGLFIGLGAIALLIGGVGIANVMVIAVLERRAEIGVRRALGALRIHIASQFLLEALVLSAYGAALGAALGTGAVMVVAALRGWAPVVPVTTAAAAIGGAVLVGVVAGALPALRASRLAPTEALHGV